MLACRRGMYSYRYVHDMYVCVFLQLLYICVVASWAATRRSRNVNIVQGRECTWAVLCGARTCPTWRRFFNRGCRSCLEKCHFVEALLCYLQWCTTQVGRACLIATRLFLLIAPVTSRLLLGVMLTLVTIDVNHQFSTITEPAIRHQ